MTYHNVSFPRGIALGSLGGPTRKTFVSPAANGFEARNALWADSRRKFNAGYGLKGEEDVFAVLEFFEERRGKLHSFRFRDRFDSSSNGAAMDPTPTDQLIGIGDGVISDFQLTKQYGSLFDPYIRSITKPEAGTVRVAIDGTEQVSGFSVDHTTGVVSFTIPPLQGESVTAGFRFDNHVRFDTDEMQATLSKRRAGEIMDIPIVEVRG